MFKKILWCLLVLSCQNSLPVLQKLKLTESQTKSLRLLAGNNARNDIDLNKLMPRGNYVARIEESFYRIEKNDDIKELIPKNEGKEISFFAFPMAQIYQFYKVEERDAEYRAHQFNGIDYSHSPEYKAELKERQEAREIEETQKKAQAESIAKIGKLFAPYSKSNESN